MTNNMRLLLQIIVYIAGFIIVTLLGIWLPQYWVAVPAFWPFGYGFLTIMLIGTVLIPLVLQGKSPQVITKTSGSKGYWSVNRKDIVRQPWYKSNNGNQEKIGEMIIMMVGGIDYGGINPKSNSDYPVLIFPSVYLKKVGLCYDVDCNLIRFEFNQLPPFLRHNLQYKYKRRIKESTPIYFGVNSTRDGTATPSNDNLLEQIRVENEYVTKIEEINVNLYKEIKKADERKTKQFFIREAGNLEEQ